jgi:transposase
MKDETRGIGRKLCAWPRGRLHTMCWLIRTTRDNVGCFFRTFDLSFVAESDREPLATPPAMPEDKAGRNLSRKHSGRQSLPAHLERVEKVVACTPAQCTCVGCGKVTTVIGYEESEPLDASLRASTSCSLPRARSARASDARSRASWVAPASEQIIAKSLVSDQIVINMTVAKYCDAPPLYRQSVILKVSGWSSPVDHLPVLAFGAE